jgi:hypothetical protein
MTKVRKPFIPSPQALQLRKERYAAAGPNCPNGHSWAENAIFNKGYRFCDACLRAGQKASQGSYDLYWIVSAWTRLHPSKHDDHLQKLPNLQTKAGGKTTPLEAWGMDEILRRARQGETSFEISGESRHHQGKGIISRIRLLGAP